MHLIASSPWLLPAQVLFGISALRNGHKYDMQEWAFVSLYCGAQLLCVVLRWWWHRAYTRLREPLAAALQLAFLARPAGRIGLKSIDNQIPWGRSGELDGSIALALVALVSSAVIHTILALSRPMRLQWHVPTQLVFLLYNGPYFDRACASPAFTAPAAQALIGWLHDWTGCLLVVLLPGLPPLLWLPGARPLNPHAQCKRVLRMTFIIQVLIVISAVLAMAEAKLRAEYNRQQGGAAAGGVFRGPPGGIVQAFVAVAALAVVWDFLGGLG
jgi:hypothetical protein